MAYGAILGQKPIIPKNPQTIATNVNYDNTITSSIISSDNVQGAIDQLFTSVSNGKTEIASAITDKGVSTSASDSFTQMATNINNISTGFYSSGIISQVTSNKIIQFSFQYPNALNINNIKYVVFYGCNSNLESSNNMYDLLTCLVCTNTINNSSYNNFALGNGSYGYTFNYTEKITINDNIITIKITLPSSSSAVFVTYPKSSYHYRVWVE